MDVTDPSTGLTFAKICLADPADVTAAVHAAEQAHKARVMIDMAPSARAKMLRDIALALRDLKPEGAGLLSRESGKRRTDAEAEFDEAIRYFEYYSGLADKLEGRSIPLGPKYIDYTVHVPYGVTAHIVPWNFPLSIAARSLAPALAMGNCAIVKVPELAPLATLLLGKACQVAEVPAGVVSILCGTGVEAGETLVNHPDVQQVVFTGSVAVGQRILLNLSQRVVPAVTELGGKSAAIVTRGADLDKVIGSVFWGIFFNAGQVCSAMSRLVVPREMQDEIATLVTGGHRIDRAGFFVAPTLFKDVTKGMVLAQEEVFGPVLILQPYDTGAEALEIANATKFGLASGVFSQDIDKIGWFSDRLIAGQVYVNEWYAGGIETPFGGMKLSGNGRDKGQEAIFNYLQTKNIAIKLK
jgi:aldehyde dehydrogenase (NAD+)